ncbi:MAG: AI-2E family transporter [Betaproteobacteria bacterium]|nr:AI-2E family transporter [Betaproteobacteria bacterium]
MEPGRSDDLHYLWWLALAVAIGVLLYLLSPMLTPFLLAAILAYICNPVVQRMERRRIPRALSVALVLLLLLGAFIVLLLIMLPLLVKQAQAIARQVPAYVDWFRATLGPWLEAYLGVELDTALIKDWLSEHLSEVQAVAVKLLPSLKTGGLALIEFAVNAVLVPVVLFYFLRDWNRIVTAIDEMVPRRWHDRVVSLLREIDDVLGQFLRGQLTVMLIMSVFYTAGLWLAGLDFALSVGIIAGLVTFVPYLGLIVGVSLATLTGVLQFGDLTALIWVWAVFVVGNLVEGYVLVPFLVGERIGLHPVAVIFALLAFGQLFGFFGVLLALPVSAALVVWLRHVRRTYLTSGVYNA